MFRIPRAPWTLIKIHSINAFSCKNKDSKRKKRSVPKIELKLMIIHVRKSVILTKYKMRSVSHICAHLSIVYVIYIINKCAHMCETERTCSDLSAAVTCACSMAIYACVKCHDRSLREIWNITCASLGSVFHVESCKPM